jgi:hypothetical protein
MRLRDRDGAKTRALRDRAKVAVIQRGRFEPCGGARLTIPREGGLMIGIRAPFKLLPKLGETAKYGAAQRANKRATRQAPPVPG